MLKAIVHVVYGTGGALPTPHRYWSGTGVAFHRSAKRALAMARRNADRACGEGASWVPVMGGHVLLRGVQVIEQEGYTPVSK